ncbi:MAG TPA: patatin-like phospholipase family protein [Pirellulales bacterium]|jgi:hypothetical protein
MERNRPKPLPVLSPQGRVLLPLVTALLCFALAAGCTNYRACVPTGLLVSGAAVDLNSTGETDYAQEHETFLAAFARIKPAHPEGLNPAGKKHNVLALSGGGSYGAFSAGILNGWTASGQRPQFDIVTGVSTGALIATYAFLGPQYDGAVRQFYTHTTTADVYHKRLKPVALCSDAFVSSAPLERAIAATVTPQLLCEVAQAHAQGRRLFIGTTNLDTGRLVIWDMGAIAASGTADSLALYRQVILASASPPGFFPPVPIDVSVNDQRFTEMHVDGGTTAQVFFRASLVPIDASEFAGGAQPLAGSCVYVIVAGKSFPDPKCVEDRVLKIAGRSLSTLTHAQTRNDLVRIHTLTLVTGMDFRMAAIPQDWPIPEDSMAFNPAAMCSLFERGYQLALAGREWLDLPPTLEPSQQSIPRSGTRFATP